MEKTYEYCPHCDTEVELDAELKVQTCPNCGKRIATCSMCRACDTEENYCTHCCLSFQAQAENGDAIQMEEFTNSLKWQENPEYGEYSDDDEW